MNLNRTATIFFWGLIASIVVFFLLVWNIENDFSKKIASGQLDLRSGEGLGMLRVLLFYYSLYLVAFIVWTRTLYSSKNKDAHDWKKIYLNIIFIFSILPTMVIMIFFLIASPNPFKHYNEAKRVDNEIKNGERIQYSHDSIKLYEANFVNDKIHGKEIERYETGEMKFEKNYKNGILEGEFISYYQNGKKRDSLFFISGKKMGETQWYENGKKSYYAHPDSLRRYSWWDNGQLHELYHSGRLIAFWEKDGTRTLTQGTGSAAYWYNDEQKSKEIIFKNNKIIKETNWYQNGNKSSQDEYIQLSEEASEKIGYNCEFKGSKKTQYSISGTIKSITYWSTAVNCKNENGSSNITYEYGKK